MCEFRTFRLLTIFSCVLGLAACSGVDLGGGSATFNDPVPSGALVAQGSFQASSNQTVSGIAAIYSSGGTSYTLRLSGLTAPTQTSLLVRVFYSTGGSPQTYQSPLRGTSGNQNYSFATGAPNPVFQQVTIAPVSTPDSPYGAADVFSK